MTESLTDNLLAIARAASDVVLGYYEAGFEVTYKGPSDPVTDADHAANELICSRLQQQYPGVPIVAEESNPRDFDGHAEQREVFFVDPLDGTREFIARNGEFVVMIGLAQSGAARAGVILAPATGRAWIGEVGCGAFEVAPDGSRQAIAPSTTSEASLARVVGSRALLGPQFRQVISDLHFARVTQVGSAGLKGVAVASGQAEVYLAPSDRAGMRWDACAIDAVVQAAGGRFSDALGCPIDYASPDLRNRRGMLATNGALHDVIVAQLAAMHSEQQAS